MNNPKDNETTQLGKRRQPFISEETLITFRQYPVLNLREYLIPSQ